jgi:hypothetical protein
MIFVYVCSTGNIFELKACFETWITKNGVKGVTLYNIPYLITFMAYLCLQRKPNVQTMYFMFDWSIYKLFAVNRSWNPDCLQIIIFVHVCLTWIIVELKTHFETWITRNDVNGARLFNLSYLITVLAYLCSQRFQITKARILCLIGQSTDNLCKILDGKLSPNNDIRKYLLDIKHVWTRNAFWFVKNKKWRKWCLFYIFYLITLMAYLCSQWTPIVQIKYFMFDCSIYRLFVLNRGWKRDSL